MSMMIFPDASTQWGQVTVNKIQFGTLLRNCFNSIKHLMISPLICSMAMWPFIAVIQLACVVKTLWQLSLQACCMATLDLSFIDCCTASNFALIWWFDWNCGCLKMWDARAVSHGPNRPIIETLPPRQFQACPTLTWTWNVNLIDFVGPFMNQVPIVSISCVCNNGMWDRDWLHSINSQCYYNIPTLSNWHWVPLFAGPGRLNTCPSSACIQWRAGRCRLSAAVKKWTHMPTNSFTERICVGSSQPCQYETHMFALPGLLNFELTRVLPNDDQSIP